MREKLCVRACSSSDTSSQRELFELPTTVCNICSNEKYVIDWNCKRGCIYEFCKDCKQQISKCPLCNEPYGSFKDSSNIPENIQIFIASDYSLIPGPDFPNKITIGSKTFYMSTQDYKPKTISPEAKESLGPIWTKIIRGNHSAYDSLIKLGSGKGLKLDIYEEWNDELYIGSFKIGITKLSQENKVNVERSHSFRGDDKEKSVYLTYEKEGSPSPSSSRKRSSDEPPPVEHSQIKASRKDVFGSRSIEF